MTQSVRSHTGPTALIKLAQDVLNTEIAGLAAVTREKEGEQEA